VEERTRVRVSWEAREMMVDLILMRGRTVCRVAITRERYRAVSVKRWLVSVGLEDAHLVDFVSFRYHDLSISSVLPVKPREQEVCG
jgi:hypothetical protein